VRETVEAAVRALPRVVLIPDFPSGCDLFFDTVHLNKTGGERFTDYIRRFLESHAI
jgi:hypothetical protein